MKVSIKNGAKMALLLLLILSSSHKAEAKSYHGADNTLCYAQAAYHEARDGGPIAMRLVQSATYNRVTDGRWPRSSCGVVYQRGQYAWAQAYRHRMALPPTAKAPADRAALAEALSLARSLRAGQWRPSITANHFLSPKALPGAQNGKPRFPAWSRCPADGSARCMSYAGVNLRAPDFTYAGTWFYTL